MWSISWGLSLVLAACSGTKPATPAPTRELTAQVDAGVEDGEVRLGPASQAYVKVEAVSMEPEHAVIRAPARVAFRDGAVSKVGAPIPGRIMKLHVEAVTRSRSGIRW
jgi:cobalt-zinc-cadmium efflux system membrane fusion protein